MVKIGVPDSDYGNGYFTFNGEQVNCTAGAICTWEKSGLSSGNQIVIKGSVNYNGVQQGYSPDMANVYVYVKRQGGTSNAGMVRLGNLPIVDQFAADVSANDHPRRYGYVLRYEPNNSDAQESGRVVVPVQHTESVVNGYLTESQLVTDSLTHGMPTDVLTADVQFNLSKTNTAVFYNTIQGKVDSIPADYRHYLTVGILTISSGVLGNATYVRIVINGALDSGTSDYTLTVNGESKTLTNTFTDYAWESGSVSSKTFQTVGDITIKANTYSRIGQIVVKSGSENITGWNINSSSLPAGWQFDSNPSYTSNGYMYFDNNLYPR